jgi:hypothetical protein
MYLSVEAGRMFTCRVLRSRLAISMVIYWLHRSRTLGKFSSWRMNVPSLCPHGRKGDASGEANKVVDCCLWIEANYTVFIS